MKPLRKMATSLRSLAGSSASKYHHSYPPGAVTKWDASALASGRRYNGSVGTAESSVSDPAPARLPGRARWIAAGVLGVLCAGLLAVWAWAHFSNRISTLY